MADKELLEILTHMREILMHARAPHVVDMSDDIVALLDSDEAAAALKLISWKF